MTLHWSANLRAGPGKQITKSAIVKNALIYWLSSKTITRKIMGVKYVQLLNCDNYPWENYYIFAITGKCKENKKLLELD